MRIKITLLFIFFALFISCNSTKIIVKDSVNFDYEKINLYSISFSKNDTIGGILKNNGSIFLTIEGKLPHDNIIKTIHVDRNYYFLNKRKFCDITIVPEIEVIYDGKKAKSNNVVSYTPSNLGYNLFTINYKQKIKLEKFANTTYKVKCGNLSKEFDISGYNSKK